MLKESVQQEWVSYPEAERYSGLSHTTLWRYVTSGDLRDRPRRPERENSLSELARVHGARLRELMRTARDIDAQPLPGIAYAVRPDATAEAELSALANVYRYVLNKNAASVVSTNGDDAYSEKRQGGNPCRPTAQLTIRNRKSRIDESEDSR